MSILPPKVIEVNITDVQGTAFWTADESDEWAGLPYQFRVVMEVFATPHSYGGSDTPHFYNGLDIRVGDWVCNNVAGAAAKVVSIESQTGTEVTFIVEDEDRFSTFVDYNQEGNGGPVLGRAVVFTVNDDGAPILTPWPTYLPLNYATDIMGRFAYRNTMKDFVRKQQADHGFAVGDFIYIDGTGMYHLYTANEANKLNVDRVVGQVTSVGIPGADWFTFKARGQYRRTVPGGLPTANAGDLIYFNNAVPGKLTAVKPSTFATPVFLRLNGTNEAIEFSNAASTLATAPTGSSTVAVYKVSSITERDAIDPNQLNVGDQIYVTDTGQGEWAYFVVTNKSQDAVVFTKLADEDSSTVDGRTVSKTIGHAGMLPHDIYRISPLNRITVVTVEVTEAYHPSASLSIGDDADNERLVSDQHIDLSTVGTYTLNPSYQYGGTGEEWIRAYLNPGTTTTGQVVVTISYI